MRPLHFFSRVLVLFLLVCALGACGIKGDPYRPSEIPTSTGLS